MKKSKLFRTLTLAVAAALCMATTTVTAYAGGADPDPVPLPETTEAPAEVPEETEEPTTGGMEPEGVPVTPQGNAALVDDFFGDKQLKKPSIQAQLATAKEEQKKRPPAREKSKEMEV